MKHPPYHLRVNKAIDRVLLVEILEVLKGWCDLSEYTYYGFGGPFLEDCRLIHSRCPEIRIISIEKNTQTYKRQQFHKFSKGVELKNEDLRTFLASFRSRGREVFWLDYNKLKLAHFNDFMSVLGMVSDKSVVKVTIRAEPLSNADDELVDSCDQFENEFRQILPANYSRSQLVRHEQFVGLLQEMVRIASQRALPPIGNSVFQVLNTSHYKDQCNMLSITGIVCDKMELSEIQNRFSDWNLVNLDWASPRKIDVPILSIKERLHLEKHLPTTAKTGKALSRALGYKIDNSSSKNAEQLKQYEQFYQYFPYFARISI